MFTALLFALTPVLQSGAGLHSPGATVYVEAPDIQGFFGAWESTLLPSLYRDHETAKLLAVLGAPDLSDLSTFREQAPEVFDMIRVYAQGIKSLSLSINVDHAKVESLLPELVDSVMAQKAMDRLYREIFEASNSGWSLPEKLSDLAIDPQRLLDAYGNPYVYRPNLDGHSFDLIGLGADGKVGGSGRDRDRSFSDGGSQYHLSLLLQAVSVQAVVEWGSLECAAEVSVQLKGGVQRLDPKGAHSFVKEYGAVGDCWIASTRQTPESDWVGMRIALTPTQTIFAFGQEPVEVLANRILNREAPSLQTDPVYTQAMDRVQRDQGVTLWRGMARAFAPLEMTSGGSPELQLCKSLINWGAPSGSAWETRLVDGMYVTDSFETGPQRGGSFGELVEWISNDAVFVNLGTMPAGDAEFMKGFISVIGEELGLVGLGDNLVGSVEGDFLSNLTGEYAIWADLIGGLAPPMAFVALAVEDGERAMAGVASLADSIVALRSDFSTRRRTYRGYDMVSLNVGVPVGFSPAFVVIDDVLLMCNSSQQLRRVIRAKSKGALKGRGEHPLLAEHLDGAGALPANFGGALHCDFGSIFRTYYSAAQSLFPVLVREAEGSKEILEALPSEAVFTRNFRVSRSWTEYKGGAHVLHSSRQLAPECALLPLAVIASRFGSASRNMAALLRAERPVPVEGEVEFWSEGIFKASLEEDEGQTRHALTALEAGLMVYWIDYDAFPPDLGVLLVPTGPEPKGYLETYEAIPTDEWAQNFVYADSGDGHFTLYSIGPNGVDDSGEGDDINYEGDLEGTFKTMMALFNLELSLDAYAMEHGGFPPDLRSLLAPSKAAPGGYLFGDETALLDEWGQSFIYADNGDGSSTLYSIGADGVDELGMGDDLKCD